MEVSHVSQFYWVREYLLCGTNEHVLKPVRAVWAIINERASSVNIHTMSPPSLDGSNYRLSEDEASGTYFFSSAHVLSTKIKPYFWLENNTIEFQGNCEVCLRTASL